MAPRPANPPADRRQEILDAALQVFAQRGYSAATNAEIAREAGVTAAALYYYFPSKADLFRAAVSRQQEQALPPVHVLQGHVEGLPLALALRRLLEGGLAMLGSERGRALVSIVLAEGPRHPELAEIWRTQIIDRLAPVLISYLQGQAAAGRIRPVDPRVMVMLLVGPVLMTVIARDLLRVPFMQSLADDDLVNGIVDIVCTGLLADR